MTDIYAEGGATDGFDSCRNMGASNEELTSI
jgi:hypothetical protein